MAAGPDGTLFVREFVLGGAGNLDGIHKLTPGGGDTGGGGNGNGNGNGKGKK